MNGFSSFGGGVGGFGGIRGFSSPISFKGNSTADFYMQPKSTIQSNIAAHYMPKLPNLDAKFPINRSLDGPKISIASLPISNVGMRVPNVRDMISTPMIDRMVDLPKPAPKMEATSKEASTLKVEVASKPAPVPKTASAPNVQPGASEEKLTFGARRQRAREEMRRVRRERMHNARLARIAAHQSPINHDVKPPEEKSFLKKVGESLKNGLSHVGDVVADETPVIVPNNAKDYHLAEQVNDAVVARAVLAEGVAAKVAVDTACATAGGIVGTAVAGPVGFVAGEAAGFMASDKVADKIGVNKFVEYGKEMLTSASVELRNPQSESEKAALTQSIRSGVDTATSIAEFAGDFVASGGTVVIAKKAGKVLTSGAKKLGAEAVESAKATLGVVTGNNGLRLAEATTGKETAVVLGKEAEKGPIALFAKGDGKGSTRIHKAGKVESAARIAATQADADKYLAGITSQKGVLGNKCLTVDKRYEYFEFKKNCEYMGIKFKKGDFISRDNLHHEWEWFRGAKDHRGPIDPLTGIADKDRIDPGRILNIK